jgi:hypothetical protein
MIGKIAPNGSGARGLAAYLLHEGRGRIVAGTLAGRTPRELSREIGALRRLNPKLNKAIAHLMLSPAEGDPPLTDEQWQAIAECYAEAMGYADAAWCGVVHNDTDHQHLHIMACRIDLSGKTISDSNTYRKSEAIVRRIEREFGLVAVASPTKIKRHLAAEARKQNSNTTTNQGDHTMQATDPEPPANPFEPGTPEHAVYPQPYEPGRDDAELAIIDQTPSIVVPSARVSEAVSASDDRKMRRAIIEKGYQAQVQAIFGPSLSWVSKHGGGAVLYFRDGGRIADRGSKLQAMSGMDDELAAQRIVSMAVNAPKKWKTITFTGSDAFLLAAMREARKHHIHIIAVGEKQQEILAKVMAEGQGGMASASGPQESADPILAPLMELDALPTQTSPRTAPIQAPVVSPPPAPQTPAAPSPTPAPVVGVMPAFLNLRERIKDRRDRDQSSQKPGAPSSPKAPPTIPRKPGLP